MKLNSELYSNNYDQYSSNNSEFSKKNNKKSTSSSSKKVHNKEDFKNKANMEYGLLNKYSKTEIASSINDSAEQSDDPYKEIETIQKNYKEFNNNLHIFFKDKDIDMMHNLESLKENRHNNMVLFEIANEDEEKRILDNSPNDYKNLDQKLNYLKDLAFNRRDFSITDYNEQPKKSLNFIERLKSLKNSGKLSLKNPGVFFATHDINKSIFVIILYRGSSHNRWKDVLCKKRNQRNSKKNIE